MHIRRMQKHDIPNIVLIEKYTCNTPWEQQIFEDCLKYYDCFVLEDDYSQEIAGYGVISRVLDEAHLLNIVISSKYQKQGFGAQLIQYLLEFTKTNNGTAVYLEVGKSNFAAINLYKKFKFTQIGIRKDYYKSKNGSEDALVFKLSIQE